MPNPPSENDQPDIPPLTPSERAFVLEHAGEAYFLLTMGVDSPERDDLEQYYLVRTIFFRGMRPEGKFKQAQLTKATTTANTLWNGLTVYVATNPRDWVFPEQRLQRAEVGRLACTLRKVAERIHAGRHPLMVDREQVYVSVPVESFFDFDPEQGTVKPESIGVEEIQIPFALRLKVRDDMVLDLDEAVKAFQRVMAGDYGYSLREHLREAPELEHTLADGEEAVLLVSPTVLPPMTVPSHEPQIIITAKRVKQAVLKKFRRGDCEISWYAGRCYVDVPGRGLHEEPGRYICFENLVDGIGDTGLSFRQV